MSGRLKVVQASEAKMSAVIERHLDLKSVQSAWKKLTKLVPLGPITGDKAYEQRARVMDELLERIGGDESHPLMPLLDLLTKQIEAYEEEDHNLPDAMLAEELGGQSVVSAILNGKRELNTHQVKALGSTLQRLAGGLPLNC